MSVYCIIYLFFHRDTLLRLPSEQSATVFMLLIDELISYEEFMQQFTKSMNISCAVGWKYSEQKKDFLQLVQLDFMAKVLHMLRQFDEHNRMPEMKVIQQRMVTRLEVSNLCLL